MCPSCIANQRRLQESRRQRTNTPCEYTFEQLELFNTMYSNSFIKSQLALYHIDCNRYSDEITKFLQSV